jgi:hypothetical protein
MQSSEKTLNKSLFGMYPPAGGYMPKRFCGNKATIQIYN